MYSLITKSAVLLSILTLLPLASASAELKRVPLILMDHGLFDFRNMSTVDLEGTGTSTHLGKIVSTGVFENVGNHRSGGFKGEIEGSSTSVLVPSPSPTVTGTAPGAATATPTNGKPNAITYRLSAEFFPGGFQVFSTALARIELLEEVMPLRAPKDSENL